MLSGEEVSGFSISVTQKETCGKFQGIWGVKVNRPGAPMGFYFLKCGTMSAGTVYFCSSACVASPKPSILSSGSSRYDFGDEDAGVVAHMRVVCSSRYAEAKAWVALQ